MTVFMFVLIIIFLSAVVAPLAKGIGDRLAKGEVSSAELRRLIATLEQTEQRLSDAERRLQHAEDRLDFQEKLLGPPERSTPDAR
jgi:hypothetical protein